MKSFEKLKATARHLKREITALYYAYGSEELGLAPKILIGLTIGYALSPIDLIPDFIPLLGYLDDLIILPLLIWLSIKMIPSRIMEDARVSADKNPLTLKKNVPAAVIIILIWIGIIFLIISRFLN
ncbi:YkvA family protein [Spirochaeta isovalerica]|uniref:Uncharacterized membrane protein YkvA (DUF1232 family) n=1 Tax=Spirochaeta isovalerica TaxID=150 RepID=A0A841R7M7_9SPIO|nr:uncharacterized membrane protein YkvA (DUF1232 family) [Spirochaeta isovalerica]